MKRVLVTLAAPYRPATVGVIALCSALLGLGMSVAYWTATAGAFDLRDLIVVGRQSLTILAFPLGWLGVWAASVHGGDSAIIGGAPGRPRQQIVLRQAAVLAAGTSLGWLAGWSVPVSVALTTQYWTPVDVLAMVTLSVAVGSIASIGLALAMLAGVRVGAFLTPVGLLAVMLVPAFWLNDWLLSGLPVSTQALSYVWSITAPSRGTQLVWGTEVVRLGFYVLVAFAVAQAAAGLAEFRATRRRSALTSASWLVFPLAASVAVSLVMPLLYVKDPNDQVACAGDAGYTLCLFQIDEPHRDEFATVMAPLMPLLPRADTSKVTVTQDPASPGEIGISRLGRNRDDWMRNQLDSIVRNLFLPELAPDQRCEGKPEEVISETYDLEASVVRQVSSRAAEASLGDHQLDEQFTLIATSDGGGTSGPADKWLDHLSNGEFRDWYQQNLPRLTNCTLTEQDFT